MKSADNRPAWSSFETGYHRARRALAVVQRAGVVCLLALATVIVASRTAYGQDLPDSGSPGSAIWTGDSMIIWGGYKRNPGKPPDLLNTGWSLNPVGGGVWTRLTNMAPLSARTHQVAVWTGKEMIVWGGSKAPSSSLLNDGAAYNPTTDTWRPMTTNNAPSPRRDQFALWTGTQMLIWGGGDFPSGGGAYDPVADTWTPITDNMASIPSIDGEPQNQTVKAGQSARLSVVAQGAPPLAYQWRFGTNNIAGATNYYLTIDHAQPTDAGPHSVIVTNFFGVATSTDANLIVLPAEPLDLWTSVNSGTTHWLGAVAGGPRAVVAVGASGTVVMSTNGVDWFSQFSGITNNLYSIVYGNAQFVAAGDTGLIITSPDGINWTTQLSNTTNSIYGLTVGDGIFVGVGVGGLILTLSDGSHWARQQTSVTLDLINVAFGNGGYAAIVTDYDFTARDPLAVGTISILSTNGIEWSTPQDTGIWSKALVFGDGNFFSVGRVWINQVGYRGRYYISHDGVTWATSMICSDQIDYYDYPVPTVAIVGNGQLVTNFESMISENPASLVSADVAAAIGGATIGTVDPWTSGPSWSCGPTFEYRKLEPQNILGMGLWHSRFVGVGEAGAIYLSGTLPPYLSQISQAGNATTVSAEGLPLESYVLQSAATINGPWQLVSTNSTSADGIVTFTDPTPSDGANRFYRVSGP